MSSILENLICGLRHYKRIAESITEETNINEVIELHSNIGVLIHRGFELALFTEIVYPAKDLQEEILKVLEMKGQLQQ
jgi:hypothetical protein